jgi:hypothetical protein
VHETLNKAREAGRKHGAWDKEQRTLAAESLKDRVKHRHELAVNRRLSTNGNLSADIDSSAKNTDLWAIKQFLSNPLEYHLSRTLGIRDDDDTGDMTATDEPLDSGYKISALRKKVWIDILSMIFKDAGTESTPSPESIIESAVNAAHKIADDVYDDHIDSGQAPEGHICRMERESLKDWAVNCAKGSAELLDTFPHHQFEEKRDSFLSCGDFTINVRHEFAIVPKDDSNTRNNIGVIVFDNKAKPADNIKLWLDGLTIWLNEMRDGGKRRPVVLVSLSYDDKHKVQKSSMSVDDRKLQDVERWLTNILAQMLIDKRCEHMPFAVIADIIKQERKETKSYEERLQKLTANSLMNDIVKYKTYTDGFNLTDAKPPEMDDGELRELAGSRYAPILGRWIHE